MSSPTFVPAGDMERVVYDADQDGIVDNSETLDGVDSTGFARSTSANLPIYVDMAATGAGTGVSWANAFTTIQAAINSLPAVINHAVTIYVRKGSTAYDEAITIQRDMAGGSIVIRGEYYWYGTNNGTQTGILDLNTADPGYGNRANIAAGDVLWATKWSGTLLGSAPSESIIDTVASVSGASVTLTTNTTKEFDTTWTYRIVKTALTSSSSTLPTIYIRNTDAVTVSGLDITGGTYGVWVSNSRNVSLSYIRAVVASGTAPQSIRIEGFSDTTIGTSLIESSVSTAFGVYATKASYVLISTSIVNCTGGAGSSGIRLGYASAALVQFSHILAAGTGLYALQMSFIGTNSILNSGTTAKNPATNPGTDGGYII